jgi:putative membrane protein
MRLRDVLLIAVPATVLTTVSATAQTYGDHPHMGAWGWGGTIIGPIITILFIALIVGTVVVVIRWMGLGGSVVAGGANKARQLLDERFARGEIGKDDYEECKRALSD